MAIRVEGLRQLHDKLNTLDRKRIKPTLRKALRAGAKLVLADARKRTPVRSGNLRKSLRIRATPGKRKGTVSVSVITGNSSNMFTGTTYYGGMVHFGTKHQKAQPWLEEAFKSKQMQALQGIIRKLKLELDKEQ